MPYGLLIEVIHWFGYFGCFYASYTLGEKLCKTSFQVGMDLKKLQKQCRDERTQRDFPTLAINTQQI